MLIVPSLVGGITGALLLRWTPPAVFDRLVPFLILFATLLFMAQEPVQRMLKTADRKRHPREVDGGRDSVSAGWESTAGISARGSAS